MTKWRVIDKSMAASKNKSIHGGIMIRDWFSDKLFMAFNISILTRTDNAITIG